MVTVFIFVYLGLIDMLVPHSPVLAQGKAGRIYIYRVSTCSKQNTYLLSLAFSRRKTSLGDKEKAWNK